MRKFVIILLLVGVATLASPLAAEPEAAQSPPATTAEPDCVRKAITCSVLKSCAEACSFLKQCGFDKLDRDKDGIPCESLCPAMCDAPG